MLMPKRTKYRKHQRGTNKGLAVRGSSVSFGDYALKAEGRGLLTSRQIEAARKAVSQATKRGGKLWIRVFPDKAVSKKPNETRMGSGKSPPDHYAAVIKPGKVVFELAGVAEDVARRAFKRAADKFPMKMRFITKE